MGVVDPSQQETRVTVMLALVVFCFLLCNAVVSARDFATNTQY
jgi:hypothetical protein